VGGNTVSVKVYVGNLPYTFDDKKLKELFLPFGAISEATVIQDKYSGRSKGFGFVTFDEKEAADKAISEMNDKEIQGRAIKVNEARPLDPNGPPKRNFSRRDRF
jgi:RNA recognition motif-containing protein